MWFVVLFSLAAVGGHAFATEVAECRLPLQLGKLPCKAQKSIKFHFDAKTGLCMAFEYTGCGGNKNLFDKEGECYKSCLQVDHLACPANSAPLKTPETCFKNEDCGPKGTCAYGNGFGICCDKAISDRVDTDYNPKCAEGRKVHKITDDGYPSTLIGKTCKSNHCPKGATCVQGTYFATCCV